ncbi:MAG: TIGR01777 family oxidoreductase [Chlamydiia bacterium]|nr:TIGR01777 family oxidoreductase [Chlamydiia bacterium]MCP5491973.1 TIGR01777 family protein [Chlamydiales bacterium]
MKIGITGSHGFIGSYLKKHFSKHDVISIERKPPYDWALPDITFDAVVHLSGANIAKRWTPEYKKELYNSRVIGTRNLVRSVKTNTLISASAIGYYGNRGDEELDEDSSKGSSFLSDLCGDWEAEALKCSARVCMPRFGLVLGKGGPLDRMIPAFKWCLGGRLGDGRQWMSWIALQDLARGIEHLITNPNCEGAYNFCSPNPVRNQDFTLALAKALHRFVGPPIPEALLRFLLGEMADGLFLNSCRVVGKKLLESGFSFLCRDLSQTLSDILAN